MGFLYCISGHKLCSGDFAGSKTSRANVDMAGSAVLDNFYSLYVRFPSSVGSSMRVRNLNSESYALSANFAFSHEAAPPLFVHRITSYILANFF